MLHKFLSLFYQSRSKELIAFRAYSADTGEGHKRRVICTKCNGTIQVMVRFVNSLLFFKNNKSNFKVDGVWSELDFKFCPFQEYVPWPILIHSSILELLFHCFKIILLLLLLHFTQQRETYLHSKDLSIESKHLFW